MGYQPYERLGEFGPLGSAVLLISLALSILLQELALRLREEEQASWWASNGRDVANGMAVALLMLAIRLQGISWPLAILLGATLTLILSSLGRFLYGRTGQPWLIVSAVGVALVIPLVFLPRTVAYRVAEIVDWLF